MRSLKNKKPIIPLPFFCYYIPVLIIALIGFFDSIYLSVAHYRVYTDIGYTSFCAISKAINCDTVSQSPYSIFLKIPVPVWGVIGYTFLLILLAFSGTKSAGKIRIWALLFLASLSFSLYSIILAGISTFLIHSYCIMCILSYGVNFLLLYFSWLIRNRFNHERFLENLKIDVFFILSNKISITLLASFLIFFSVIVFNFPKYWLLKPPELSKSIPTGYTEDGYPWIGAENPELTITEFTDYLCFQCRKMHFYLRRLVEQHPDKLRLIHRNFPMDSKINPIVKKQFHEGSAKMAFLALYASEKQKFWEMNDLLIEVSPQSNMLNMKNLCEKIGLNNVDIREVIYNKSSWRKLQKDIRDGLNYGLIGTPGYVIDGNVYQGQIPAHILEKIID